jgi:hypothetical protein
LVAFSFQSVRAVDITAVIPMKRIEKAATRTVRTLLVFVIVVAPVFPDCPQELLLGIGFSREMPRISAGCEAK